VGEDYVAHADRRDWRFATAEPVDNAATSPTTATHIHARHRYAYPRVRYAWSVRETTPPYGPCDAPEAESRDSGPDSAGQAHDDEALTSLGEEIMTLSEHLQAETHRLLMLIAEFDRLQGWKFHGFRSCADWLAWSTRVDKVTAREKVRVAKALARLPETCAAMATGELSFSQVRAITRVADEENERELLVHARQTSAAGLERLVRSWRRLGREDEATLERRRHESRCLSVFPDEQGMYLVRGTLDPEVGALLMRAIEAASDALYRGSVPETTPEQRRADALALLMERALAAGVRSSSDDAHVSGDAWVNDGDSSETDAGAAGVTETVEATTRGEYIGTSTIGGPRPVSVDSTAVSRADRYLVLLHVDSATLSEREEPGRSELEDGTRVSAETSRRLSCDANVVRVSHAKNAEDVRVEGKTRTVPPGSAVHWRFATEDAASRAADRASRTLITSGTGRTADRPGWTTWSCCAARITDFCTKAASGWNRTPDPAAWCSSVLAACASRTCLRGSDWTGAR
jgi:hypothetical protein